MEEQMQAGGVDILSAKKIMEDEIIKSIKKFQDSTGFLPIITQVITSDAGGMKAFTSAIKITIDL